MCVKYDVMLVFYLFVCFLNKLRVSDFLWQMELDVHLTREGDEWWGLQLFGGVNGELFTIAQVDPGSPAHAAGLQPGDTVTRIGDKLSRDLSPDDARSLLAEAVGSLAFGVCRGLYDPVLDNFESIYEPTERADSDLQSEPTEVSPPRYVEFPEHPITELDFQPITDSRSLTASPFLTNTKPYRPFSTEPLPASVPPLEDPIILNPEFKDDFGDILEGIDVDKVETKYKLPVSQQYDPSYRKRIDGILEKSVERERTVCFERAEASEVKIDECIVKQDVQQTEIKEERYKDESQLIEEAKFDEEMKLEIDMVNIEQTAIDVVEESIERAVSVTKEIQEIVEEELRASATRELVEEKVEKRTEEISELRESELKSEVIQSEVIDEVDEECKAEQIIIDEGEVVEKPSKEFLYVRENKHKTKTHEVKTEMTEFVKKEYDDTEVKRDSGCKQNAFNIGLQTIPNIRGMAQSSYHFDLLMRTFFIHLTDVMVAMSRFILTQPALQLESTAEKVINDQLIVGLCKESLKGKTLASQSKQTQERKNVEVKHDYKAKENIETQKKYETKSDFKTQEHLEFEEMERKRLSGVEMAQRTQRKPKNLTNIMDAVISEFETKTGIEDRLEVSQRSRRSKSKSRIEEEVMNESDPLEWLAKVDRQSQERTSITTSKNISSQTESKETRRSEVESRETRTSTPKPGKQMYVAVVESHVYTNKDEILQEMLETSSIESTEEMSTAVEIKHVEKQQAVEVITQALDSNIIVTAESTVGSESKHELLDIKESRVEEVSSITDESIKTAAVEISQDSFEAFKEFSETKVNKQKAIESKQELSTSIASETTEIVENVQAKSFNVLEVFEKKPAITSEENYKATAILSTETLLEESKEEMTELKISEKHAKSNVEQLAIAIAGTTDIIMDDSKAESFETKEKPSKTAIVREELSFKTAAVETTEVTLEEAIEQHAVTLQTGHATIRETNNFAVAGIIETKVQEEKIKTPKPAEDEFASLKIIKQEIIDDLSTDVTEITESEFTKKSLEIENHVSETSMFQSEKLHIQTNLTQTMTHNENDIDTPTPSTIPPTPLTDEYVFKLQIPLPKHTGPIITEDSSDHEDLSIVKRKLVPHIEASVDETIIYDPPLPTPEDKDEPVYTKLGLNGGSFVYVKPGLRGGANIPCHRREYIREIERKSSLLASAIDQTIKSIEEYKEEVGIDRIQEDTIGDEVTNEEDEFNPEDELVGFKAVHFEPDNLPITTTPVNIPVMPERRSPQPYIDASGKPLGSVHGIIDGLEDPMVDEEVAKELGKPGLTEDKIAELISGESEMLREAHVMGLSRVLSTHMNKPDDSSVDFKKIKPLVESLKNSEVLAALNAEFMKSKEDRQKDDRKWTTFLQKPQRPTPRAKHGYYGYLPQEENEQGPYKVKIVKQPKPKVAPDYNPEDFETGPLPWEERALTEPPPPPVALEDPILVPEDSPEFFEAVDPLPESSVPDLQDTGIVLPPPRAIEPIPEDIPEAPATPPVQEVIEELPQEEESKEMKGDVEEMAEQLVQNVKGMVDPNAPIQQQLAQMRAQLAALAQLPCVIQQSLEILTNHLATISQQETRKESCESQVKTETFEDVELQVSETLDNQMACVNDEVGHVTIEEIGANEQNENTLQEEVPEAKITLTAEEYAALKREEEMLIEEQIKNDKLKKVQERIEHESRQIKQRAAPRVGKPKMFGPQNPDERPLVLPGGRRWKGPKDVFNDQFIAETLQAQAEVIQGKVMGFESDRLPFDDRINFMKYEKPPVSLDHLQHSDVYKAVHGMEPATRRVDLLTPVVAEADYRERCRSMTPTARVEEHLDMPQQLQP